MRSLAAALLALVLANAWPISAAAVTPRRADSITADRADDLGVLKREYVEKAPTFSSPARRQARELVDRTERDAALLSEPEYALRLARVAALADNAHDSMMLGYWRPPTRLPLRLAWFPDALVVARAAPGYEDLVGASVIRVGRLGAPELFAHLRPYQGGPEAYRRWNLTWILQSPALLEALDVTSAARPTFTFRLIDGRIVRRTLAPIAAADVPQIAFPAGLLSPELSPDEQRRGWRAMGQDERAALYLAQPGEWFRTAWFEDSRSLYVQFRSNMDVGGARIAPFVASLEQRLQRDPPQNLILDLRFDTGGDNTQNRALMRSFADRVPGRIFVLSGPYTFSAGIASAAALVHDSGGRAILVGEEVGDRTSWWSEHQMICLPHSGACFSRNVGLWDIVNGCAGRDHCFGDQFDLRVPSLAPAVKAPLTSAAWRAGEDPAMDAVLRQLARGDRRRADRGP